MPYLFMCALGPVQDFIATARRSRDLWYGSWMLSELSKAAAKYLNDTYPGCLIFPAPKDVPQLEAATELNVANKVMAAITDPPDVVGPKVRAAVLQRLEALREDAFAEIGKDFDQGGFDWVLAERQITDLPEIYWVGVQYGGDDEYLRARTMAEHLLAARKTTRDFAQAVGSNSPKSSLDGARESVIPETMYPARDDIQGVRAEKVAHLYEDYGARGGERLSGVDILKRLGERGGGQQPKFKSTSHMAAAPYRAMLERTRGAGTTDRLLDEIRAFLKEAGVPTSGEDDSLLYESRLRDVATDATQSQVLGRGVAEIREQIAGHSQPGPYYVLLAADGDHMGAAINAQKTSADHQRFSQALSEFAAGVEGIVAEHQGVLVYSGGDDVLAYLPVHTALACAQQLSEAFKQHMQLFGPSGGGAPTLSAGLVVAHLLEPLSDALALARDAEKTAKDAGRDALAMILSKRSGADRAVAGQWAVFLPRFEKMIGLMRRGAISKGAAYELEKLNATLGGPYGLPPEALAAEAVRIVKRKRESGGEQAANKDTVACLQAWIEDEKISLDELAHELILANFFAGVADLAYGEIGKEPVTHDALDS